jgi:hypothetical protein
MVSTPVVEALGRLTEQRERIVSGQCRMSPGQPATFTHGCVPGSDMISQGDLDLLLEESVPKGFTLRKSGDGQLVPGTTAGSKHVVVDASTCDIYDPPNWSSEYDELVGPVVVAKSDTVVGHPTHGAVTILAGQTVHCEYQRVFEHEAAKERRQRD